jgi:hypothetical protein
MKKHLLFLSILLSTVHLFGQSTTSDDCFKKLEAAFNKRGSLTVADAIHSNVIISFFEDGTSRCVGGKVRVENGTITSVFLQFEDGTYELMDKKFYNFKKMAPVVTNGISEMINTVEGERFRVVFMEKLKPKKQVYKEINLPDDL